jgi:hypothetical protein
MWRNKQIAHSAFAALARQIRGATVANKLTQSGRGFFKFCVDNLGLLLAEGAQIQTSYEKIHQYPNYNTPLEYTAARLCCAVPDGAGSTGHQSTA